jgi:hypothetical protein
MEQEELTIDKGIQKNQRDQIIANLKAAIEVQELQTNLQELRTRQVIAHYNEIRALIAFEDLKAKEENNNEDSGKANSKETETE